MALAQATVHPATNTNLVLREELENGIVRLTLNRPEARNSLSLELMRQLMTRLGIHELRREGARGHPGGRRAGLLRRP